MADTKISALTADATPGYDSLIATIDDPGGTPASRKTTINELLNASVAPANTSLFSPSGYSLTGSDATSMIDLAGTWNTTGTPTAIKMNVTDTASNAASLLMDLQVGGSSKFRVTKSGGLVLDGTIAPNDFSNVDIQFGNGAFYVRRTDTASSFFSVSATSRNIQVAANAMFGWSGTDNSAPAVADLSLYRDAANTLALRNSTNAQAFNIYSSYTDGSNYTRGALKASGSIVSVEGESAGTGSANIDVQLTPKGTGRVRFGSHSAIGAETVTGFITIKDSGGTERKIAVVS